MYIKVYTKVLLVSVQNLRCGKFKFCCSSTNDSRNAIVDLPGFKCDRKLVSLQYYPKLEFGKEFTDNLKIFVSPSFHEGSVKLVKVSFDKVLLWARNEMFLRYIGKGATVLMPEYIYKIQCN